MKQMHCNRLPIVTGLSILAALVMAACGGSAPAVASGSQPQEHAIAVVGQGAGGLESGVAAPHDGDGLAAEALGFEQEVGDLVQLLPGHLQAPFPRLR